MTMAKQRACGNGRRSGQAMIELAVFGFLMLFLLAQLVQYGLQYDYSQYPYGQTYSGQGGGVQYLY